MSTLISTSPRVSNKVPSIRKKSEDPTVTHDANAGYGEGSIWLNTTSKAVFVLTDNKAGAASWDEVTGGGLPLTGGALTGPLVLGSDASGVDVTFHSGTAGDNMVWDASEEKLTITGTNAQTALDVADGNVTIADDLAVDGTANLDNTDIDGTLAVDGTTVSLDATTSLNIDNTNTSNGITVNTATSGSPISIGHATSVTTVNDELDVTGTVDINDATDASNSTTGALKVDGGVGIAKKLYVGTDLHVSGGQFAAVRELSGSDNLYTTDFLLRVPSGGGAATITIPTAQCVAGRTFIIKDQDGYAGSYNISVTCEGSQTIDGGATTVVIGTNKGAAMLICASSSLWFAFGMNDMA